MRQVLVFKTALLALCIVGCSNPNRVIFVTSTEVGIGADPTVGNVNIGYDRNELVVGPAYPDTGGVPPVYAKLDSDLAVFNPRIKQLYATGQAAILATDQNAQKRTGTALYGERKFMVFGTSTNVGLKVQFTGGQPPSINLGYKRKEFSALPLRKETPTIKNPDKYGSLIAGISMRVRSNSVKDTGVNASQFIATGDAADNLASDPNVRKLFAEAAVASLARAAVMTVPVVVESIEDKKSSICRKLFERNSNVDLDAKLSQIEDNLGYKLVDFCNDPNTTEEWINAIEKAMDNAGIETNTL